MTYKTRQEVLRAAADWIDVCEMHGVEALCKWNGLIKNVEFCAFDNPPEKYEFPLALLEGKEVWVGSELCNVPNNFKFVAEEIKKNYLDREDFICNSRHGGWISDCSWNPPKPKTVTVEMLVEDAENYQCMQGLSMDAVHRIAKACKKALESMK